MKEKELRRYQRQLLALRERHREEIERITESVRSGERAVGEHDQTVSEAADKELTVEHQEEDIHRQIEEALQRVDSGTFGVCRDCGGAIVSARLDAVPYAPFWPSANSTVSRCPLLRSGMFGQNQVATTVPGSLNAVFMARGVTKIYHMGEVEISALRGIDLDLYLGEFVVLLGPSGSGKSTLLNLLGGLDVPTSGEIWFRDHDLTTQDDVALTQYRRDHVGFVFQFYNLIPSLTARENVALVADIAEHPLRPEEALQLVGLADRMDHFPAKMSGGEQQRVAVARAIAKRPDVLLCDEPTGALDFRTGILVLEVIERANRELGTTTAIITHNAGIAAMADRVVNLSDGRISDVQRNVHKTSPRDLRW